MRKYILAITTCPETKSESLARILVENGVCACVNIINTVKSIYRWKDDIVSDTEAILLMKTEAKREEILKNTIIDNHPYDIPEFIVVPIESGAMEYLDWISSSLSE